MLGRCRNCTSPRRARSRYEDVAKGPTLAGPPRARRKNARLFGVRRARLLLMPSLAAESRRRQGDVMSGNPGEKSSEEPQSERAEPASRDSGSDEPGGDRPKGPSTMSRTLLFRHRRAWSANYGGTGTRPPTTANPRYRPMRDATRYQHHQPAISLPIGQTAGGLPVDVQLVAALGREDLLLRVAAQLETAAPWSDRRPLLS